jgi:hypothetical protein
LSLGQIIATLGALEALEKAGQSSASLKRNKTQSCTSCAKMVTSRPVRVVGLGCPSPSSLE